MIFIRAIIILINFIKIITIIYSFYYCPIILQNYYFYLPDHMSKLFQLEWRIICKENVLSYVQALFPEGQRESDEKPSFRIADKNSKGF